MLSTEKIMALDIETACDVQGCVDKECKHGLDPFKSRITVAAYSDGDQLEGVIRQPNLVSDLQETIYNMTQDGYRLTFHNGKFDIKGLLAAGIDFDLAFWKYDSALMAFTHQNKITTAWLNKYEEARQALNKERRGHKHRPAGYHSLKTLAPYFLKVEPFWEPEHGHDDDEYVLKDARYTAQLTRYLLSHCDTKEMAFFEERQLPWAKTLLKAEMQGISLDEVELRKMWSHYLGQLSALGEEIQKQWAEHFERWHQIEVDELEDLYSKKRVEARTPKSAARADALREAAIKRIKPFNLDSPKQLLWLLTECLGLDARNYDGKASTDKETLHRLAEQEPSISKLLAYRKARKLCSTYFPEYLGFANKGKIHTTFNAIGTRTGRLSASNPNLQQVPAALHSLLKAEAAQVLVTRDLSAIEPTILAYYSEDRQLCKLMLEGGDFHGTNAHAMFNLDCDPTEVKMRYPAERKVAKECGLAVLYGAGAGRIHQVLQKHGLLDYTLADAKKFVYRIRDLYEGVWTFKKQLDNTLEAGATIYNYFGRPLSIKDPEDVYMQGLNTLIQSTASDILQQAATDIGKHYKYQPLLLVHDELVVMVPKEVALTAESTIIREMTKFKLPTAFGEIKIKTEGKISSTWEK